MNENLRSPIVRFFLWFMTVTFVFSSPISGYFLTRIFLEARASAYWPTVPGIITKVQVIGCGIGRFRPDVAYTYGVSGRACVGFRVRASDGEYNVREGAEQAIEGLAVGQKVMVYYNPADPHESVLQAGAGFQEYALLVVPLVMPAIGAGLFWLLRRTGAAKPPPLPPGIPSGTVPRPHG